MWNPPPVQQAEDRRDAIGKLQAGGSTAGGAGIQLAYKVVKITFVEGGNNRVILLRHRRRLQHRRQPDAEMVPHRAASAAASSLTVLGFGMGNYKDNKMQQLADKGNGNHAYIDDISEAKKVLVSEFRRHRLHHRQGRQAANRIQPHKVKGYRLIGYENRVLNNEDFNDDKGRRRARLRTIR